MEMEEEWKSVELLYRIERGVRTDTAEDNGDWRYVEEFSDKVMR